MKKNSKPSATSNPNPIPVPTKTPHLIKPILKRVNEISTLNTKTLNQLSKIASRSTTKFHIGSFSNSFWNQRHHTMQNFRQIANILHHEKHISTLKYVIKPQTSSGMRLAISTLKNNHHISSLNLHLDSLKFCTPQHLKSLFMTLSQFKNLASFTINFPMPMIMTPQLLSYLFSALNRLASLKNLTINFTGVSGLDDPIILLLSKHLSKLTKLNSLTLNFGYCFQINSSILTFLASAFRKLTLLHTLSLNLFGKKELQNDHVQDFFVSLIALKSLKHFNLNLGKCDIDMVDPDPVSQGLLMLQSAPLETLTVDFHENVRDNAYEELATGLKNFPSLKHLSLNFDSEDAQTSDRGLSKLATAVQKLKSLSSFDLSLPKGRRYTTSIQIIGTIIKPLGNLTSLTLKFAHRITMNNKQLAAFSENLKGLAKLRQLTLAIPDLWDVSDEGIEALGNSFKGLKSLESLRLEFPYMRMLTSKGLVKLCSGLGSLNKLTFLHFDIHGNEKLDKEILKSLGEALKKMTLLNTAYLDFNGCKGIKGDMEPLLKGLAQLKMLKTITLICSHLRSSVILSEYLSHIPNQNIS